MQVISYRLLFSRTSKKKINVRRRRRTQIKNVQDANKERAGRRQRTCRTQIKNMQDVDKERIGRRQRICRKATNKLKDFLTLLERSCDI